MPTQDRVTENGFQTQEVRRWASRYVLVDFHSKKSLATKPPEAPSGAQLYTPRTRDTIIAVLGMIATLPVEF